MAEMEESPLLKPLKQFQTNYLNLLEFYKEFSSHSAMERALLENTSIIFHQNKWFLKFLLELLSKGNIDPLLFLEILGLPEDISEGLSEPDLISYIVKNILTEMDIPPDKINAPELLEELQKPDTPKISDNLDPTEILNFAFQFGFKVVGLDLGTNVSEIEANFREKIQDATSESLETEKRLLTRLWSVCIIQLYTILESFLKDIVIAIAADDLLAFFSAPDFNDFKIGYREHILSSATKEEIIEKVIEDSADNYQRWYNAEKLFNSKKMTIFPSQQALKEREQAVWNEDLKVDDDLSVRQQLQKFHLYRNALVHNNGEIREKDLRNAKIKFIQPQQVVLNENYVRHSFILVRCIVRQIYSQLIESSLGDGEL